MIAVSIVSHSHGEMVEKLVGQLCLCSEVAQIILTLNVPENLNLPTDARIHVIQNETKNGFSTNHNSAFQFCDQPFFCVLNPDIVLIENPFPSLIENLQKEEVALVAPQMVTSSGCKEDNLRQFPTISSLIFKMFRGRSGEYRFEEGITSAAVDWVAGMFMMFRSSNFSLVGGFDERYFLYYDDVDICMRLSRAKLIVLACPTILVVHDAQRTSRRRLKYLFWHISSMIRFFVSREKRPVTTPFP